MAVVRQLINCHSNGERRKACRQRLDQSVRIDAKLFGAQQFLFRRHTVAKIDMDFTEQEASREGKRRALELFGWMYGFALALWLIGYYIAIPLMVLAYMLRHRETLVMTIALPAGAGLATWVIFGHYLHLPFPPGILLEWAGLV